MAEGVRVSICVDDWVIPFTIRKDETVKRDRFYACIKNPYVDFHDSKVIYGSTGDIVRNKVERQIKKWRDYPYEREKYKENEPDTGGEDLPFV